MNLLDKAIETVSPNRALERTRARMALDFLQRSRKREEERFKYDGAMSGRRADGWQTGTGDANTELMGALVYLRDRSRDLVRNNPHAVKALEELVGNTVGTGITPKAATGDNGLDAIIDNEWPYFAEQCDSQQRLDFNGMEALVMRTMGESGESIIRYRPRVLRSKLRIPLQLQLLESDFLDQSRTMGIMNGHVMQGVEFDLTGQRIAYWLFSFHPGGVLILNPRGGIISEPVPADQILHVYRMLRPGQVRGVPWLAPVMMALRDLDGYEDAERLRKKIEACVVALITAPSQSSPIGIQSTDATSGDVLERFEPGMIATLKSGQDVKFNNPPVMGGYEQFIHTELHAIAAGIGLPYELLSGDLSKVNYSSYRGGLLSFRNTIEVYRWLTLIPLFCQPVRRKFIDTLVLMGKLPSKVLDDSTISLYKTSWTAPKFESVDPYKDARGELLNIRMGRTDLFESIIQAGYDPMDRIAQIAKINKLLDEHNIVLDCDPRNVDVRGNEQPSDSGPIQHEDSSQPANRRKANELPVAPAKKAAAAAEQKDGERLSSRDWTCPTRTYLS